MIWRWPKGGFKPGKLEATINTEDIMPTLLALSGTAIPKSVEGLDFSGYLRAARILPVARP